jgi:hypothetical protein
MLATERRRPAPAALAVAWFAGCLAAALLAPAQAPAGELFMTRSNADLLKYCRTTVEAFDATKRGRNVVPADARGSWELATAVAGCQGFIEGFRDAMDAATRSNTSVGLFNLVCLPETANTADLASAYVQWVNANPAHLDKSASMGVYRAWRQAWPCAALVRQ